MKPIYLDYNATTPVAPSVIEAMQPFFARFYGNASSLHSIGRAAAEAIADARAQVAAMLACDADEIVFTSGGTESNNLAIKGIMLGGNIKAGGHLVISSIEHPATTEPAKFLQKLGFEVTVVQADSNGIVQPTAVERALRKTTRLVSVMHANNETGIVQPIRAIAEICHARAIPIHSDAAQTIGKIPVQADLLDVDLLSIAAHKFYGPKGVGALYVREGLDLEPAVHGASHEWGLRPGTENTAGIVGLGKASSMAARAIGETTERISQLRDRLQQRLQTEIGNGLIVNGANVDRLPNTLSMILPGVDSHKLLQRCPEICASTGAACHSGTSHVSGSLDCLGITADQARGALRISVGLYTSGENIEAAADAIVSAWEATVA